ncbi:MAG TPA: hypothetical protein VF708_19920 [Pyrinomonadaceae bacterium]
MTTGQFLAILIPAMLGSGVLSVLVSKLFDRRTTAALAHKTNAETSQIHVKTRLEFDEAQIKKLDGTTETVLELLDRAQKQSEEIERQQTNIARLLRELEAERAEKAQLQAVIKYQREENMNLRETILRMAEQSNDRQRQIDHLSREVEGLRQQLAELERRETPQV